MMSENTEKLKQWAIILGIVGSLASSISAHFKDETKAKSGYKELSSAIEKMSEDQIDINKDISNIRGYLAGHDDKKDLKIDDDKLIELLSKVRGPAKIRSNSSSGIPVTVKIEEIETAESKKTELPEMKARPKPYVAPKIDAL